MANICSLQQRLDDIRGKAPQRSPNVRTLAAFAQHTDCRLASAAFAARVDLDRLLVGTRLAAPFGQSPFALSRGHAFEDLLRKNDYAAFIALLRGLPGFPAGAVHAVNLRVGFPKGLDLMERRARATADLLRKIVRKQAGAPDLIDGAVLTATVGGRPAYFEADAAAALARSVLRVAEVKSFPKVDERVDPAKLGAALDQAAIYILLVRALIAELGGNPERLVPERALLVTPRNVGLTPTLSEQNVGPRVRRAGQMLAAVPSAADVAATVPAGLSFGLVADTSLPERRRLDVLHVLADRIGTAYQPACLSNCGNARFCRQRAFAAGSPCLTGLAAVRLLPGIATIDRAAELSEGTAPSAGEAPAPALLRQAGRLYDSTVTGGAA
jgi:hypothetical protein